MYSNAQAPADAAPDRDEPVIRIAGLSKRYPNGFEALSDVSLDVRRGEIFALLGPNGAGKTTLIGSVCGIVRPTAGSIHVEGFDVQRQWRHTRAAIGLVPQELTTDAFESVQATVSFSRGLFGLPPDPAHVESVLRALSLWDKRDSRIMMLSGGMKRRVLIAKALAHQPRVLFLDEPTAGVDVTLRQDMWALVGRLRAQGVTVILTTHYIEEAQAMADRIGIITGGRLRRVDGKAALMAQMGRRQLVLDLDRPLPALPQALSPWPLQRRDDGLALVLPLDDDAQAAQVPALLHALQQAGIGIRNLSTTQSTLEDIVVSLIGSESQS